MPFDIGIPELVLIFVVVLMVFGPDKIPDVARQMGKVVAEVKRMGNDFTREITGETAAPTQSPARRVCPRCATPNPISNYFCFQCGMNLVEQQKPPPNGGTGGSVERPPTSSS